MCFERNVGMEKKGNGRGLWFLVPVLMALPVVAGLVYVMIHYGQMIQELLLAACKVVIVR